MTAVLILIGSLVLILGACHFFTNAIEWFGKRLGVGQAVVGSIFAAVGTAMPETMIPVIAILVYGDAAGVAVGVGAIAGAPFMLATLAFFVTGAAVVVYRLLGRRSLEMTADPTVVARDLTYFLIYYGAAVGVAFFHEYPLVKYAVASALVLSYGLYVKQTFGEEKGEDSQLEDLLFARWMRCRPVTWLIVLQVVLALGGIIVGAHIFVSAVKQVAQMLDLAPLILSIIITPIATELPEKFNSIIWVGRRKDTLAIGNITGAMVFQCCFPVAFAVAFTTWDLHDQHGLTLLSAVLALAAGLFNLIWLKVTRRLNPFVLMGSGLAYVAFILYLKFVVLG